MKMMFAAGFRIFVAACRLQMFCSSLPVSSISLQPAVLFIR
jgi:hypothetical protein